METFVITDMKSNVCHLTRDSKVFHIVAVVLFLSFVVVFSVVFSFVQMSHLIGMVD